MYLHIIGAGCGDNTIRTISLKTQNKFILLFARRTFIREFQMELIKSLVPESNLILVSKPLV